MKTLLAIPVLTVQYSSPVYSSIYGNYYGIRSFALLLVEMIDFDPVDVNVYVDFTDAGDFNDSIL